MPVISVLKFLWKGRSKTTQKQHVKDWFFAHARPSWMGVSFMDWSRYSNTAWSSSAVAGRFRIPIFFRGMGTKILVAMLRLWILQFLLEAFEAATNPAEKSDILRQILTLLIRDLKSGFLGVFWFDHRKPPNVWGAAFVSYLLWGLVIVLEHGGLYVDMDCPVWAQCLGGWFDSRHAMPACLLLQDFECLRPLDELHHVTSFYTGMSNVPLATVGIGIGIKVLLENNQSKQQFDVLSVKLMCPTVQKSPNIILMVQKSS